MLNPNSCWETTVLELVLGHSSAKFNLRPTVLNLLDVVLNLFQDKMMLNVLSWYLPE